MDLQNLITFLHVAELGSFTKAARTLGYSQSTVSFQIKQLEMELNSQLFERINHTVALTDNGRKVLKYAHRISNLTSQLQKDVRDDAAVSGHVRLATADSLCDSLLDENFIDFRRQFPDISLQIIAAGTEEMFRLIDHNEADAILTLDNHIYDTRYVIVREEKVGVHFVASSGCPLCRLPRLSLEELAVQPFLLTEKGMSYRRLLDEKLAESSLEIQPVLETGSAGMICQLVEQGAGISFLPDYVTAKSVRTGSLCYLPVKDLEIHVWKQLLYHRDKWLSPQLSSVLEYCVGREFSVRSPCQ